MSSTPLHQTYLTVENGTPYAMEIAATVENEQDWASGGNRPDKNLNAAGNKPLTLDRFAVVKQAQEDISSSAQTANLKIAIKIRYQEKKGDKVEDKTDELILSVNQYEAQTRPALAKLEESAEEANEYAIPNSRPYQLTGPAAAKYQAVQYFPENADGKLEQVFSIFEKREG